MTRIPIPERSEYAPSYAGYIALVEDADVLDLLRRQPAYLARLISTLPDASALHRYDERKWSIKEVLGHLSDAERVFAYRALRIGRGDRTPLPAFDENAYVAAAGFDARPLTLLLGDFVSVRAATLSLLGAFGDEIWPRHGVVNGNAMSVRAVAHIIAGHAEHHFRILRERYGLAMIGD